MTWTPSLRPPWSEWLTNRMLRDATAVVREPRSGSMSVPREWRWRADHAARLRSMRTRIRSKEPGVKGRSARAVGLFGGWSRGPQREGHRQARGADRRQEPAGAADGQRPPEPARQQRRGHLQLERDL